MDKIPKFIEDLSNKDLRQELQKVGINSPITPTTRRLFQKKLARKLGITAVLKFEVFNFFFVAVMLNFCRKKDS